MTTKRYQTFVNIHHPSCHGLSVLHIGRKPTTSSLQMIPTVEATVRSGFSTHTINAQSDRTLNLIVKIYHVLYCYHSGSAHIYWSVADLGNALEGCAADICAHVPNLLLDAPEDRQGRTAVYRSVFVPLAQDTG
jgi:hypothetical protein